jgi:hypothetical protein
LCPLFAYGSTVKTLPLVLVLVAALGACDLTDRSKDATSTGSVQRARTGDLPTAKEVATIYPGMAERDVYGIDRDPFAHKTPRCTDDWRLSVPFTSGRWSSYQDEGGNDPFFSGGEGPSVDVLSFASPAAATAAVATFSTYVDDCQGSGHGTSDYPFTRRKLDVPAGFVGFSEQSVVDVGDGTEDRKDLHVVGSRDEFVVAVRIQTDGVEPNAKRALELARLARRVAGRAPEVPEPVPDGAVLHDYRKKPLFVSRTGKASSSLVDLSSSFRAFVRAKAATVTKVTGGEYAMPDCTSGMDILMYRTDGFAQLSEVTCVGDGAPPGYLVAEVDGAWTVIDEVGGGHHPGGQCARLSKAHFPSSIVGSWCQDGSSGGHEYPTG